MAPVTFQLSVTGWPALTVIGSAVKLATAGDGPVGTFDGVYTGFIRTTSKLDAVMLLSMSRSLLFQWLSGMPVMKMALPLSARIMPYFLSITASSFDVVLMN